MTIAIRSRTSAVLTKTQRCQHRGHCMCMCVVRQRMHLISASSSSSLIRLVMMKNPHQALQHVRNYTQQPSGGTMRNITNDCYTLNALCLASNLIYFINAFNKFPPSNGIAFLFHTQQLIVLN